MRSTIYGFASYMFRTAYNQASKPEFVDILIGEFDVKSINSTTFLSAPTQIRLSRVLLFYGQY